MTGDRLPEELAEWPAWTPGEAQLGELELITSGAFAPLTGFLTAADLAAIAECGELADGTPWPLPVTLTAPASVLPPDAGHLVLQDPEGSPLAVLAITERTAVDGPGDRLRLAGPVTALRAPEHGPFRGLRRSPADVRQELAGTPVLALATRRPLTQRHISQLRYLSRQLRARILLLPLVAGPAGVVGRPEALVRAVRTAAGHLPDGTLVVPVPLAPRGGADEELRAQVVIAAAHGATHLLTEGVSPARSGESNVEKLGVAVVSMGEWAYDPVSEVWRPLGLIEPGAEQGELPDGELGTLLDSGATVPSWLVPSDVAAELRRARPPRSARGVVVFCTGLSGSGKSTLARDLRDALLERGDRTVSLLDGDLVRRLLSAGLTFSREDRDLNIARIGYVATEVARHGGIAICAPIAPYAAARSAVRSMVREVGDFLLVYVSTPLEVCEQRDRKGLYAQARAGVIGSFTGISDPYEEPADADLVIDTSVVSRHDAVAAVLTMLTKGGWLGLSPGATRLAGVLASGGGFAVRGWLTVRCCHVVGVVDVLRRGTLVDPGAELGGLASYSVQPPAQRVRHGVALPGQQHVARQRADDERERQQDDPAGADEVEQDDRDDEQQDAGGRVGKSCSHSTTDCRTRRRMSARRRASPGRCCRRTAPRPRDPG